MGKTIRGGSPKKPTRPTMVAPFFTSTSLYFDCATTEPVAHKLARVKKNALSTLTTLITKLLKRPFLDGIKETQTRTAPGGWVSSGANAQSERGAIGPPPEW